MKNYEIYRCVGYNYNKKPIYVSQKYFDCIDHLYSKSIRIFRVKKKVLKEMMQNEINKKDKRK